MSELSVSPLFLLGGEANNNPMVNLHAYHYSHDVINIREIQKVYFVGPLNKWDLKIDIR